MSATAMSRTAFTPWLVPPGNTVASGPSAVWHAPCTVLGMVCLLHITGCPYWIPIPYAENVPPTEANKQPGVDEPVILATHSVQFYLAMSDTDPLTFNWALSRDGHQSPSTQGVDGETQWQQVTLQPAPDFDEQTLKCVVSDGTSQVIYEWDVVGS